jgi:hypothetical protein
MIGIGTPNSQSRIPRPISLSLSWMLKKRAMVSSRSNDGCGNPKAPNGASLGSILQFAPFLTRQTVRRGEQGDA